VPAGWLPAPVKAGRRAEVAGVPRWPACRGWPAFVGTATGCDELNGVKRGRQPRSLQ